jgi:hypothetical protein
MIAICRVQETATTCRERCGGQGYLSCNRFGQLIGFAHAGMTAEGDNRVLMQKVAKELLSCTHLPAVKARLQVGAAACTSPHSGRLDRCTRLWTTLKCSCALASHCHKLLSVFVRYSYGRSLSARMQTAGWVAADDPATAVAGSRGGAAQSRVLACPVCDAGGAAAGAAWQRGGGVWRAGQQGRAVRHLDEAGVRPRAGQGQLLLFRCGPEGKCWRTSTCGLHLWCKARH